jgi:endoglycosylceramidase
VIVISCQKNKNDSGIAGDPTVFQDSYGRTLIFHGTSLYTNDEPGGYTRYNSNGAKRLINDWGLNSVRLFWNWNAIEPDSAVFSPEKLEAIVSVVENFTHEGVYVILAVNGTATSSQDKLRGTWQAPYGNAPDNPSLPGNANPAQQEATRRFWDYKNYAYLQDEFINASKYIAERLRDNPFVLGYDIINEPWGDGLISTILNTNLESQLLPKFYQIYITEMRKTDPDKYIFFEPSVLFNTKELANFQTKLPVINDSRSGVKRLSFAPHCYLSDLALHDPAVTNSIKNSYAEYLTALKNKYTAIQQKQHVPIYIGEWASIDYTLFPDWENFLNNHMEVFDEMQASWSYFSYIPGGNNLVQSDDITENPPVNVITRVYPMATAGKISSFHYDPATKKFNMTYENNPAISQPTEIFIPERHYPAGYDLSVAGISNYTSEFDAEKQLLKIWVNENATVSIEVTPK